MRRAGFRKALMGDERRQMILMALYRHCRDALLSGDAALGIWVTMFSEDMRHHRRGLGTRARAKRARRRPA